MSGTMARVRSSLQRHEFARHVLTLLTGTAIGQLVTLISVFLLGRLVAPAEMGVYNVIYTLVTAIIPAAALRYDMAIVLPRSDADARHLVRIATWANTATALLLTVGLIVVGRPLAEALGKPAAAGWLYAAGALGWLFTQLQILSYWLTRRKNFALASQNKIHQAVTTAVVQVGAALLRLGAGGLIVGALLGRLASLTNLLRKDGASLKDDGSPRRSTRELLYDYRKMPLLNAPNAFVDFVRLFGIATLVPVVFSSDLGGQFAIAWLLLQAPLALLNAAISQVFLQRVSTVPPGEMLPLCRRTLTRAALLGIVPFALIGILSPWAFPWLMPRYAVAGQVAAVLTPWLALNLLSSPLASVAVVVRRQGALLLFSLAYCAAPLAILWSARSGPRDTAAMLETMAWVSATMSLLLLGMITMMLLMARGYDDGARASEPTSETS